MRTRSPFRRWPRRLGGPALRRKPAQTAAEENVETDRLAVALQAQEHRTIPVWVNFVQALREWNVRSIAARKAAVSAWVRWWVFGTPLVFTLAIGGLLAGVLAFQANALLSDQNQKIDLQNRLAITQSHQQEAQRNILLGQQLTTLIAEVRASKRPCPSFFGSESCVPQTQLGRLAAFSQQVTPYRIIEGDEPLALGQRKRGAGIADRLASGLRDLDETLYLPVPIISSRLVSRERGRLLLAIVTEKLSEVSTFGRGVNNTPDVTFHRAFLPSGAPLMSARLEFADLREAVLQGVELEGSLLVNAQLQGADLRFADMQRTVLVDADLSDTNLSGAILSNSQMSGAKMIRTDASRAEFLQANLAGAVLRYTNFAGANLSTATGLTTSMLGYACWDSLTVFPDELKVPETPASGCSDLWPSNQAGFYSSTSFANSPPRLGDQIVVQVLVEHVATKALMRITVRPAWWSKEGLEASRANVTAALLRGSPPLEAQRAAHQIENIQLMINDQHDDWKTIHAGWMKPTFLFRGLD